MRAEVMAKSDRSKTAAGFLYDALHTPLCVFNNEADRREIALALAVYSDGSQPGEHTLRALEEIGAIQKLGEPNRQGTLYRVLIPDEIEACRNGEYNASSDELRSIDEGDRSGRQRERDDQAFLAPQRAGERAEVDFIDNLGDAKPARRGFHLHDLTPTNAHPARLSAASKSHYG